MIKGESMWPTFADGDEIFFELFNEQRLEVGDIVVANHPLKDNLNIVKRIAGIGHDEKILLEGDNPDPLSSEDGHNFGPVNKRGIYAILPKDMIEEVQSIRDKKYNIDHIDYIGFSEISPYLDKKISIEDTIEKIHIRTRQYAKRQMKWFDNQSFDSVFDMDNTSVNDIVDKLVEMN